MLDKFTHEIVMSRTHIGVEDVECILEHARDGSLTKLKVSSGSRGDKHMEEFENSIERYIKLNGPGDLAAFDMSFSVLMEGDSFFSVDFEEHMRQKSLFPKRSMKLAVTSSDKETLVSLLEWFVEDLKGNRLTHLYFF